MVARIQCTPAKVSNSPYLSYHFLFGNPLPRTPTHFHKIPLPFSHELLSRSFAFLAKYSVGEAPLVHASFLCDLHEDMYIRAHTRGKCHYRVLAISRSHEARCSRNAKSLPPFLSVRLLADPEIWCGLSRYPSDPSGQQRENTFTITLAGIKPGLRSDRVYIFYVQFAKGNGLPLWAL